MDSKSLADGEGVLKSSPLSSSSSLFSPSPTQPKEKVSPGGSRGSMSGDGDAGAAGLGDGSGELTGEVQHPVRMGPKLRSSSSAAQARETVPPGDSSTPQSVNPDVEAVVLPDLPKESTGDQHHSVTPRSTSRSPSPSSLLALRAHEATTSGYDKTPQSDSHSLEEDLRPQDVPLPSSPALEGRESFESEMGSVHHSSGSYVSQQTIELYRRSESPGSRRSFASSSRASSRALHDAWVRTDEPYKYLHIVTGEIFHHRWREPEEPGPSADDIPEGWEAKLVSEDEEEWEYVHLKTRTVIDLLPKTLPEAIMKQFDVAETYGEVPDNCQGQLEDDQLMYKCINPSDWCPTKWRTTKHPEVIEEEMDQYLANLKIDSTKPATVTFLAKSGQQMPFDFETSDINQMSGILLITDIDKVVCDRLSASEIYTPLVSFFIVCHFLLRTLHKDEATKELAREAQGWYWSSMRTGADDIIWSGDHYDVVYDDERAMLHFGFAQYVAGELALPGTTSTTRVSIFEVTTNLTMVLIGNVTLDRECIQNDDSEREFGRPRWWLPSVPVYLGLRSSTQTHLRAYLVKLLRAVARDLAATGLPRVYEDHRKWDLDKTPELLVAYRLVMSTWKDGIRFLVGEIDYFWEQAINGPDVSDFVRLKASKRYAEVLYQDLGAWMVNMEGLLAPRFDRGGARAMNELKDILDQILAFKQEIGDTFQLLIGAIAIKDSDIQKKLAQESKLQARRATALTALAAIYLPLSLTTGVFGMNIVEIEQGKPKYWAALAVAMGLLVATLPFLVWVYLDKDGQGWKRARPTVTGQRSADSQRHQLEKDDSTLSKSRSQEFDAKPFELVRRRTTRFSQMDWDVAGRSRPGSPRKRAQPEHMV